MIWHYFSFKLESALDKRHYLGYKMTSWQKYGHDSVGREGDSKGEMTRFLRDHYFWYIAALLVFSGILVYAVETYITSGIPSELEKQSAYMTFATFRSVLFLVTIVIAVWRFGVKGGASRCSCHWDNRAATYDRRDRRPVSKVYIPPVCG